MKLCKILIAVIVFVLCFGTVGAFAEGTEAPITVMLDGEYVQFDVQPIAVEGRTLVPVRAVFEALGAQVQWLPETQTAAATKGDISIEIQLDNTEMKVNDNTVVLDVPAVAMNNRTLVPLRAISEAFGCHVSWNGDKRCVVIVSDLANVEMLRVNDDSVSAGYFNWCLYNSEVSFAQNLSTTIERIAEMWSASLGDITFEQYLSEHTVDQIVIIKSAVAEAKKIGITLDEADYDTIEDAIAQIRVNYPEDSQYQMLLTALGTTDADLRTYLADSMYISKLYETYERQYGMNDDEIKKYLDENYVQAQHVLISTQGLDEAAKAEKKELAQEVFEKAKAGADFKTLVEQYGEDPGMEQNPDGYLFTKGAMVQEFETAAFGLKVGAISTVVETQYGYHIIKRVANIYNDTILEDTRLMLVSDKVDAVFDELAKNTSIVKNNNMFSVVVPVGVN